MFQHSNTISGITLALSAFIPNRHMETTTESFGSQNWTRETVTDVHIHVSSFHNDTSPIHSPFKGCTSTHTHPTPLTQINYYPSLVVPRPFMTRSHPVKLHVWLVFNSVHTDIHNIHLKIHSTGTVGMVIILDGLSVRINPRFQHHLTLMATLCDKIRPWKLSTQTTCNLFQRTKHTHMYTFSRYRLHICHQRETLFAHYITQQKHFRNPHNYVTYDARGIPHISSLSLFASPFCWIQKSIHTPHTL